MFLSFDYAVYAFSITLLPEHLHLSDNIACCWALQSEGLPVAGVDELQYISIQSAMGSGPAPVPAIADPCILTSPFMKSLDSYAFAMAL